MTAEECRRKFVRFPTDALVWWSRDWDAEPIALMDISAGGMLCEFPEALEKGSRVALHFEFPHDDTLIFCNATVAHCRPTERAFMVGLELVELEGMEQVEFVKKMKDSISA